MRKLSLVLAAVLFLSSPAWAVNANSGRKSVTVAGTALALSATESRFTQLTVCADPDNVGLMAVGIAPVASGTIPQGVSLGANDCYTIESQYLKLSDIKVDSTVSGESVSYEWQYN